MEEVREVAGRHTSKLLLVDLHQPGLRMTDSGSGATLDKVRRWVQGQWQLAALQPCDHVTTGRC